MEKHGYLYTPAALPLLKKPPLSIEHKTGWAPEIVLTFWRKNKSLACAGNNTLYCPVHSLRCYADCGTPTPVGSMQELNNCGTIFPLTLITNMVLIIMGNEAYCSLLLHKKCVCGCVGRFNVVHPASSKGVRWPYFHNHHTYKKNRKY